MKIILIIFAIVVIIASVFTIGYSFGRCSEKNHEEQMIIASMSYENGYKDAKADYRKNMIAAADLLTDQQFCIRSLRRLYGANQNNDK